MVYPVRDVSIFRSKQTGEHIRSVGAISTVGLSFVFAMVIGAWVGRILDNWLGTGPLFFIAFFFLGLAAGILNVYRTVSRAFPPGAPRAVPPPKAPPASAPDDEMRPSDE